MSANQSHTESAFPFSFQASDFAVFGKKRVETFANAQTELLDEFQAANRYWMDRFQSEASLASEYVSRLSRVRTIPDAMVISRDWTSSYLQMLDEDRKHMADDARKFMEIGARMFSNGLSAEPPAPAAAAAA